MMYGWLRELKIDWRRIFFSIAMIGLAWLVSFYPIAGPYGTQWFVTVFVVLLLFTTSLGLSLIVLASSIGIMLLDGTLPPSMGLVLMLQHIVLGLAKKRDNNSFLISDGLFWFAVGFPLAYVLYYVQTGSGDALNLFYILTFGLNAFVNVFIADLIWTYSPIRLWLNRGRDAEAGQFQFRHMVLHVSLVSVTVPMLSFLYVSHYQDENALFQSIRQELNNKASTVEAELSKWTTSDYMDLRLHGFLQIGLLMHAAERSNSMIDQADLVLMDGHGRAITSSVAHIKGFAGHPYDWRTGGEVSRTIEGLYAWLPQSKPNFEPERWRGSYLVIEQGIPQTSMRLILLVPYEKMLVTFLDNIVSKLAMLLFFILLTILMVLFINRLLFQSLSNLAETTTGIPAIVSGGQSIDWPKSRILEVAQLTRNFKMVTENLERMFKQVFLSNVQLRSQKDQLAVSEERLQQLAYYDYLTGLPNRAELKRQLQVLLEATEKGQGLAHVAVIFMDLDRFKHVNDTLGHAAGDRLLQMVSGRFKQCQNERMVISRHGGDEFVIVLETSDGSEAERIAHQLIEALVVPFNLEGQEIYVSSSAGIAMYPEHGLDVDTLMRNADSAMYEAKEQGGSGFAWYRDIFNTRVSEKLWLESNMRRALESGEFVLHYQPKLDQAGRLCGMEALVRWQHPERGMITPDSFIPVAESTGFIVSLGDWILREACRQTKAWLEQGLPPVRVAVNLSARQFYKFDLLASILDIVRDTGLEGRYLELEITEAFLVKDPDYMESVIKELALLDILVTIDDFGTGYSSLGQLSHFSVHALKIDRSFIMGMDADANQDAIVRSIIQLAHNMGIKVVAEGIESEESKMRLLGYGCDELQGYHISKPMSADRFEEWVANGLPAYESGKGRG